MTRMIILLCSLVPAHLIFTGCAPPSPEKDLVFVELQGETMGTYYRVTYSEEDEQLFQGGVDSLLQALNLQVSTYIETSTISRFNQSEKEFIVDPATEGHFVANLETARQIYEQSGGAFDPTVMPLVNYWGFGYTEKKPVTAVDSLRIDSLMQFVGFNKLEIIREDGKIVLRKPLPGIQLDFSAIAKGYGVDLVGEYLEAKGVGNYLVDIGGEITVKGSSPRGDDWKVGVNVPREEASFSELQTAIPLVDRAVATSGNYRNFYEVDGVKYSHTINPKTGFPERNPLLSATVIADDCMHADGYATACMVLGVDRAFELIEGLSGVEAYFIYSDPAGLMQVRYTNGLKEVIAKE